MKLNEIHSKFTHESEVVHSEVLHDKNASIYFQIYCLFSYGPLVTYKDRPPEQEIHRDRIDKIVLSDLELTDIYVDSSMELSYDDLKKSKTIDKIKDKFSKGLSKEDLRTFEVEFDDSVIKHFLNEISKECNNYNFSDVL